MSVIAWEPPARGASTFGHETALNDTRVFADDVTMARRYIRRKYTDDEARFLFRQLGIEENT